MLVDDRQDNKYVYIYIPVRTLFEPSVEAGSHLQVPWRCHTVNAVEPQSCRSKLEDASRRSRISHVTPTVPKDVFIMRHLRQDSDVSIQGNRNHMHAAALNILAVRVSSSKWFPIIIAFILMPNTTR